jgi:hypothetical protein
MIIIIMRYALGELANHTINSHGASKTHNGETGATTHDQSNSNIHHLDGDHIRSNLRGFSELGLRFGIAE